MWIHVLFVISCFIIDGILMIVFPSDATMNQLLFISNLGFCAMVLTIRKFQLTDACLFSICFGMLDTILESIILCISTIFVKDCVVYFIMYFNRVTNMAIQTWFISYEFMTILGNAVLVLILISLIRLKDDYLEMKERQVRKEEKVEWFRLKSKR